MIVKSPILKTRIRKVPKSFSWIDHRLVRNRYIEQCTHAQLSLYLFLVCVSDRQGLSFYGDSSIMTRLSMNQDTLDTARSGLIRIGLIAWQQPIYQVLSLDPPQEIKRGKQMMGLGDILKAAAMGGSHD